MTKLRRKSQLCVEKLKDSAHIDFANRSLYLYRRPEDSYAAPLRVRLWRMAPPAHDSGWVSLNQDEARVLVHNRVGDAESYLVDMLYNEGAGSFDGVNERYFGGMDVGTKPSGGASAEDRAHRVGYRCIDSRLSICL